MRLTDFEDALRNDTDASEPDLATIHQLGGRVRRRRRVAFTGLAAVAVLVAGGLGWAATGTGSGPQHADPADGPSPTTGGWPNGVLHDFNQMTGDPTFLEGKPATHLVGQTAAEIHRVRFQMLGTHETYSATTTTTGGITTFSIVIPVALIATSPERLETCVGRTSWTVYVGTAKQLRHDPAARAC